jgi:hypothetical protein
MRTRLLVVTGVLLTSGSRIPDRLRDRYCTHLIAKSYANVMIWLHAT